THVGRLPNAYLAFDDAALNNGCLGIIRGSHLEGCLPGTDDGSQLGGFFTSPQAFRASDAVWMEVLAGSLVFFDPYAVHGSGPNRSAKPRRAMIMTYQPPNHPMLKTGEVCNV
ncbi:MAG: phytanoyl-CoA dioxygenase family protein, partial [Pseudomonadales bacterium]